MSNSSSGKGLAVQTSCSDHFLSLRTTAPPAGPSRAHLAVPYETMEKEEKRLWPEDVENQANAMVWAAGRPERAKQAPPPTVKVDLKPEVGTLNTRQYPLQKGP